MRKSAEAVIRGCEPFVAQIINLSAIALRWFKEFERHGMLICACYPFITAAFKTKKYACASPTRGALTSDGRSDHGEDSEELPLELAMSTC